jgi:hypothetical protein
MNLQSIKRDIKIYFVIFGSLKNQTGTPLRMQNWIRAARQLGFSVRLLDLDSYSEAEMKAYLMGNLNKHDVIFTLNHIGIYKLKKIAKLCQVKIISDIHGLSSIELNKSATLKIKFKILEAWINMYILMGRITTISVSKSIVRKCLLNARKKNFIVYGGLKKINGAPTTKFKFSKNFRYITYIGNNRSYQGVSSLKSLFFQNSPSLNFRTFLITVIENVATVYENCKQPFSFIVSSENIEWIMVNSDILVVPRLKNKITKYSFPSKIFDYISSGTPTLVSNNVEVLPEDLEKLLFRFDLFKAGSFEKNVNYILSKSLLIRKKENELLKNLRLSYTWEVQLLNILNSVLEDS